MSKTTITEFMAKPGKGYEIMSTEEVINVVENNWKNYFSRLTGKSKADIARAIIEMHDIATEPWQHNIVDCMMAMYNKIYVEKSYIDLETLQVQLLNEQSDAKKQAKEIGHKDLGTADKAYYKGQQKMLDKITELFE